MFYMIWSLRFAVIVHACTVLEPFYRTPTLMNNAKASTVQCIKCTMYIINKRVPLFRCRCVWSLKLACPCVKSLNKKKIQFENLRRMVQSLRCDKQLNKLQWWSDFVSWIVASAYKVRGIHTYTMTRAHKLSFCGRTNEWMNHNLRFWLL
jgi:hypothetical protein